MLSIAKLAAGQQDYYLNAVARGVEDYYMGRGEPPGRWVGSGTEGLGLQGRVADEDLHAALSGVDPTSGLPLARSNRRVPGFDATFSAPKSVSLLYGFGNEATRSAAVAAHEAAVDAALGYLERHAALGRRGKDGNTSIATNGFVAAAFRHRTSRLGDPQLHTHVLIANMARGVDKRWGALDGRLLYLHKRTAGYLYQAQLRANLTRALGVEWRPVRKGMAEIAGIPETALRAFSQRRVEIEARMADRGVHTIKGAEVATLATRSANHAGSTESQLLREWSTRAKEVGLRSEDINALTRRGREPVTPRTTPERLGAALTEHASHFDRRDTLQAIAELAPDGGDIEDLERRADRFLNSPAVVRIAPGTPSDRYSTPELLTIERGLLASAVRHQDDGVGIAPPKAIESALADRPTLSGEQRAMVEQLTTSGAAVDVVVGAAGAGKTFALDAARAAWHQAGYRVVGVALAARAAAELQSGSGIPSFTLDSLLQHCEENPRGGLARETVVVLDEAGMVGTRKLDRLHRLTRRANAKLVLVGDPRQLPEIEAGGMFAALARRLGFVGLAANLRHRDAVERHALRELRAREIGNAIERLSAHGRVTECATADATREALVNDWHDARTSGRHTVMFALRRSDVADLNRRARTIVQREGCLGPAELVVGSHAFAVGDEILTTRNDRRVGVLNGTRGSIVDVDLVDHSVTMRTTDNREIVLPADYLEAGHVDHAYAMSIHKAQGMTCDTALLLGDDRLYLEAGYTGLSRGRLENRLYVVGAEDTDVDHHGSERGAHDIVQTLRRSAAQETALATARPPHGLGRGD